MKNLILTFTISLIYICSFGQTLQLRIQSHNEPVVSNIYVESETIYDPINGTVQYFLYTGINHPNNVFNHNLNLLLPQYQYSIRYSNPLDYTTFLTKDFSEFSANNRVFYSDSTFTYFSGTGGGTYYDGGNYKIDLTNVQNFLSTPTISLDDSFSIYPNPASSSFMIHDAPIGANLFITDLTGKIIYQSAISGEEKIDVSTFTNGIYFVNIVHQGNRLVEKFIVGK